MHKRDSTKLKKLIQYSAASAAFISLQQEARAFVVYQDIDPDSLITSNDTMYLDIDADGVDDMMFWIESKAGTVLSSDGLPVPYFYRFAYADGLSANVILGKQTSFSGYVLNSAYVLNSGDFIGDTIPKITAKARLGGFISVDGSVIYEGGPWAGVTDSYMGIRFKINGATHFSWLRLTVGTGGSSIKITELAYDNQVDAGIVAGTTTVIEPVVNAIDAAIYTYSKTVHIQLTDFSENTSCNIYTLSGRLFYSEPIKNVYTAISLSQAPAGFYLVQLTTKNHSISQKVYLSE